MKLENSLKAAISTVQDPDSCSYILSITESGNLPLKGATTLSL